MNKLKEFNNILKENPLYAGVLGSFFSAFFISIYGLDLIVSIIFGVITGYLAYNYYNNQEEEKNENKN